MAAVGFEEFSAPPGSELALPPLFGGHILEGELEAEVEFEAGGGPGGPGGGGDEEEEEEEQRREEGRRREEMARRKMAALGRRCRELEQVNARALCRLQWVQRMTRRLQQERRFLMKVLDSYGDNYRQSHLTFLLEDEAFRPPHPGNCRERTPRQRKL
ncbi:TCF3 fusion partner, partial [Coturnix japonica]|uniref:TCF3 fusion partner n=1 Tax=Coturnix japonica TaxID=93934 RepID=UPI0013A5C4A2